ncbi:hypothetical protein [uncultured Tenacibaculum sp.]|uniref:hypothetical protein n=1 Tax=uncultured Tenacibaculum sp. TaxID=174713 RepID=UPI0026207FFF|nr:hypothetical protein [uncultured Tenacibaculum sp.]
MKNILTFLTLTFFSSCVLFSQTNNNSTIEDYKKEIIGTWISKEDPSNKIQFLSNNILNIYIDNNLEDTSEYKLSIGCNTNSKSDYNIFLKIKLNTIDYSCDIMNTINTTSSGKTILSITSERGKLEIYFKQ